MDIEQFLNRIISIAEDKKGLNISKYNIKNFTNIADFVVVIEAINNVHIKVLYDEIRYKLKKEGFQPSNFEYRSESEWLVLDYDDVIINFMTSNTRDYYKIDDLYTQIKMVSK